MSGREGKALRTAMYKRYINSIIIIKCITRFSTESLTLKRFVTVNCKFVLSIGGKKKPLKQAKKEKKEMDEVEILCVLI